MVAVGWGPPRSAVPPQEWTQSLISCGAAALEHQLLAQKKGIWDWAEPLAPSPAVGEELPDLLMPGMSESACCFRGSPAHTWPLQLQGTLGLSCWITFLAGWALGGTDRGAVEPPCLGQRRGQLTLAPGTVPRALTPVPQYKLSKGL